MELYVLDSLFRRVEVIDRFESLIWTERFAEIGDFELTIKSTTESRSIFTTGTRLGMNESYRVMTVETVENAIDADGKATLSVKGRSLEAILQDRIARNTATSLTANPKWTITGTPGYIARFMFTTICINGALNSGDIIPLVKMGHPMFPDDTISESTVSITQDIDPQILFDAEKNLCELYDLGFRLVRSLDGGQLYFDIYAGCNRTSAQDDVGAVIFSPVLDNLQNTKELTTIEPLKNVAYVFCEVGYAVVYPVGVDPDMNGFDRRVLMVQADDITSETPNIPVALQQRGLEELSKNRGYTAFDGELNQYSAYKYGVDYNLGDMVELRNDDGATNVMRVTEQIFVSDSEGERSYPTLSINLFVQPGTWLAVDYNKVWMDLGAEQWADM